MKPSLRASRIRVAIEVTVLLVLLVLSLWLGARVIDAVYQGNPKIDAVTPHARPLVVCAWIATAIQLGSVSFCRRAPALVWLVSAAMVIVHVITIHRLARLAPHPVGFAPLVPSDAVVLVALYILVAQHRRTIVALMSVATLVLAIYAAHSPLFGPRVIVVMLLAALAVAAFLAGLAARSRSAYVESLRERAADLDRARVQESQLAVVNERRRLTREIHDTVAHALGIIVVQAQGAALAQSRHPEHTRTALEAIVDVGRGALAEMRSLLSNDTDDVGGQRAPLQGLADVPALVDQFRAAGTQVDLTLAELPVHLPSSIDHSLYRIVQEALTNAVKHGGGDVPITVRVSAEPPSIVVYVHNSSAARPEPLSANASRGHGLNGMHERVRVLGGTIATGPDPDGGFTVRADLPTAVAK